MGYFPVNFPLNQSIEREIKPKHRRCFFRPPVSLVKIPQRTILVINHRVVAFRLLGMVKLANRCGMENQPPLVTSVWLLISNIRTLPMGYDHAVPLHHIYIYVEHMFQRAPWWVEHRGDDYSQPWHGDSCNVGIYWPSMIQVKQLLPGSTRIQPLSEKHDRIVMFSGCNQSQNTRCKPSKNGWVFIQGGFTGEYTPKKNWPGIRWWMGCF